MTDILEEITAHKRKEVARAKELLPPKALYKAAEQILDAGIPERSMRRSLAGSPYGIIAEFKRKSPSKGRIHADARPEEIIPLYERAGASALSILTDEQYFGGTTDFVRRVRPVVSLPVLRKDFIIDEYQLFEAREMGADAVLLIASCLTKEEARSFTRVAHELRLEVLLEVHSEKEIDYISAETDLAGINNRHLGTFTTDVETSFRLAELMPKDVLRVSESGIGSPETIRRLRSAGFGGFLIGERFMREAEPDAALRQFISEL
ncbi:MAG: indole-3-glycerol phosphate synthase TrpC [Prevotella sp.]|nr:indole-3-glycerol phosphate synthase TrpC [Prevotella sp.]